MEQHQFAQEAQVVGTDGVTIGTLLAADRESDPPSIVILHARDGRHVRIPYEQIDLEVSTNQRIVVDIPGDALLVSEAPEAPEATDATEEVGNADRGTAESLTIPVAAEELVASTREVEHGRVRIRKRVETVPQEVTVAVMHDEVDVERVPIGREVDVAPAVRHDGDTMVVPVVEEVLVVEKRLRLVEEVRITTRRVGEERTIRENVRPEVVDVDAVSENHGANR